MFSAAKSTIVSDFSLSFWDAIWIWFHRSPEKRQKLPPALDQLLEARIETWNVLSGGGRRRHQPSSQAGQQVILSRTMFFKQVFNDRMLKIQ
jgi:hypothetical protein